MAKFQALDAADLSKLIKSVKGAVTTLNAKIQMAAVNCVVHAIEHGDVRSATQLVEAMGKGMRRQSMVTWLELNGPFAWTEGKEFKLFNRERFNESFDAEQLMGISWLEAKPEPKLVTNVDVVESVSKLLARLQLMVDKTPDVVENKSLIVELNKTLARFTAAQADEGLPRVQAA